MADPFRVVAIISAFNEADVISPVIGHLVENGVDVYLIDNHSTDGTADAAKPWLRKGLLAIEQFPAERPAGDGPRAFDWEAILRRKEALAKELSADWFIHHDADEFREAPWPGMNLRDAIAWVDRLGYNCIDFRVLNFPPLENGFQPGNDPGEHFTHWEDPVVYDTLQRKCWKAQAWGVSLATSGGHEAQFPDRRIFPIRFLMRHYPIRTQEHGRKKVFDERKKRFLEKERAKGWHVQYDSISDESHSFLGDPAKLHAYDPDQIRLDLMLDSEPSRTAREEGRELARLAEGRQKDLETAALLKHEAEKHAVNVEDDRKKLVERMVDRERHIANLETVKAEVERHANGLEQDRQTLARHIAHLEEVRAEKDRHIAELNDMRSGLARHAANLEATFAELQRHAEALETDRRLLRTELEKAVGTERDLEARAKAEEDVRKQQERRASILAEELAAIRASTIWRWSAPLRRFLDAVKEMFRA